MTTRVYFKPKDCKVAVPFERLGATGKGVWGLVEDGAWIAEPDVAAMELLYFTEAEYQHAMRRLSPTEVGLAVEHRREVFWQPLCARAPGWVQSAMWDCIDRTDDDARGLRLRAGLLTLHARYADVDRLVDQSTEEQLDYLYELDTEIIEDLGCRFLQEVYPVDKDGSERAFRRRFLEENVRFTHQRAMRPEGRLYLQIRRVFAVRPITSRARLMAKVSGEPSQTWRDRLLMGLTDREAEGLPVRLLYARSEKLWGMGALTRAQRDVELEDRLSAPDFYQHFKSHRICAASTREALRLLTLANKPLNEFVSRQVEEELRGLGNFRKPPAARPTLDERLTGLLALLDLLATIVLRREGLTEAAELQSLGRDVRKLLEVDGR